MAKESKLNQEVQVAESGETTGFLRPEGSEGRLLETPTPTFLRKRRKRRAILAAFGIAAAGIISMGIIAFLGQNFGDFTIKIDPSTKAALALGDTLTTTEDGDLEKSTTFLDMGGIGNIACTTADMIPVGDVIDADVDVEGGDAKTQNVYEEARRLDVGTHVETGSTSLNFLYFTFYLKNMSSGPVSYNSTLATTDIKEPDNVGASCSLESLLRVRVYKNYYRDGGRFYTGDMARHECKTYALPSDLVTYEPENIREKEEYDTGGVIYREDNDGKCVNFIRPTEEQSRKKNFTVFNDNDIIPRYSIIRYTIVFWLEGSDLDTIRDHVIEQPRGGSLTLSMNFGGVNIDEEGEE